VLLHQTVIGEEALAQMEMAGEEPDVVIGCVGGGSNFAGLAFPFLRRVLKEGAVTRFVAVEPKACPSMTKGPYAYDYGDTAKMTPLVKMHTLGHGFVPAGIHAGGLRYHGVAPLLSVLAEAGYVHPRAYTQNPVFAAALIFAKAEGIIAAPETAHAVSAAIDEALECRKRGERKIILFNFSGHGHFDLAAYDAYLSGGLLDYEFPDSEISKALQELPKVPA
jgi:tryptophan synthase beta chain